MASPIKNCFAISLLFTILNAGAAAAETVLACPAKISVSPAAADLPEGWSGSRRAGEQVTEQPFSSAAFSDGHPDELAFLRPSGEVMENGAALDEYDLSAVTPEGGAFLICHYKDTPAFLFKKLEPAPAKCAVAREAADAARASVCK